MFKEPLSARQSDAGNYPLPSGLRINPCYPQNISELCAHVSEAVKKNEPICISAALTGLAGAAVPLSPQSGLVTRIFMSELRTVPLRNNFEGLTPGISLSHDRNSVRVAPGITIEELVEVLAKQQLMYFPHPEYTKSMVAGNVATNASDPRSFGIGPTRDHVLALNVLLADGEIIELKRGEFFARDRHFSFNLKNFNARHFSFDLPSYTSANIKNAAGLFVRKDMDLIDLFIGSEGILGTTTEIELRVFPLRQLSTKTYLLRDESVALDLVERLRDLRLDRERYFAEPINSKNLGLISLEYFDVDAIAIAAKRSFPEVKNYRAAIQLQYFSDDPETEQLLKINIASAKSSIGQEIPSELGSNFRTSVPGYVAEKIKELGIVKLATDFSVPVERFKGLYDLYAECRVECSKYWPASAHLPNSAIWGHIGDCNLHLNLFPIGRRASDFAKEWYSRLVEFTVRANGTITAEHGAGKKHVTAFGKNSHYLEHMLGTNGLQQIAAVKSVFDPYSIFNRGNMGVKE